MRSRLALYLDISSSIVVRGIWSGGRQENMVTQILYLGHSCCKNTEIIWQTSKLWPQMVGYCHIKGVCWSQGPAPEIVVDRSHAQFSWYGDSCYQGPKILRKCSDQWVTEYWLIRKDVELSNRGKAYNGKFIMCVGSKTCPCTNTQKLNHIVFILFKTFVLGFLVQWAVLKLLPPAN